MRRQYRISFVGNQADVYIFSENKPVLDNVSDCILLVNGANIHFWNQISSITEI